MILTGDQEARVPLGGVGRKSVTGAGGPPSGPSTEDICQLLGDLSIEEKVIGISLSTGPGIKACRFC